MKRFNFLFALCSLGFVSVSAFAAVENVVVCADLQVSKCVEVSSGKNSSISCEAVASICSNVSVSLSDCTTSGDYTSCSGHWTKSVSRDGYAFDASLDVFKTLNPDGTSYYSFNVSVGPTLNSDSLPHASVQVYTHDNSKLTDAINFSSEPLRLGKDSSGSTISYSAGILVGPAMPTHP
jgi:hypothetical protein